MTKGWEYLEPLEMARPSEELDDDLEIEEFLRKDVRWKNLLL